MITDTQELAAFCQRQRGAAFLTVDTEFMREKTYYPQLCLVQVGGPEEAEAIDPLAPGIDLAPLFDLMRDESILKVFHAARQDMEIFFHLMGGLPHPVFDTQVAAMVCGFGEQVGYETLVNKLAKERVDKSSRFTDWSIRPLSDKQIRYALADVTHLRVIYEKIQARLQKNGRAEWLDEEMAVLTSPATYAQDPRTSFRRLKVRGPKPRFLAVLREVAAWREAEAQRADVPRNRVLRDESLVEIAHHPPRDVHQLGRIRGLSTKMAEGWQGRQILEAVARGLDLPEADCPQPVEKPPLPRGIGPVADLLKVMLKLAAEESGVAQRLIATSDELDLIAAFGDDADVPALKGWRRELFGEKALALKHGKLALAIEKGRVATVEKD